MPATTVVAILDPLTDRETSTLLGGPHPNWVDQHHNAMIVGPTGVGKTFVACALAHSAIGGGHNALYMRSLITHRVGRKATPDRLTWG